jgi:hypothetical protein
MNNQLTQAPIPLSDRAAQLLGLLTWLHHSHPGEPIPDRQIANCSLRRREVIDLAAELLAHGHLVIASCDGARPGRFLLTSGDDLAPAYSYLKSLRHRALMIFRRYRDLKRALRLAESHRSPDSRGQLCLPLTSLSAERN